MLQIWSPWGQPTSSTQEVVTEQALWQVAWKRKANRGIFWSLTILILKSGGEECYNSMCSHFLRNCSPEGLIWKGGALGTGSAQHPMKEKRTCHKITEHMDQVKWRNWSRHNHSISLVASQEGSGSERSSGNQSFYRYSQPFLTDAVMQVAVLPWRHHQWPSSFP